MQFIVGVVRLQRFLDIPNLKGSIFGFNGFKAGWLDVIP
jgi:hypothetical protein